MSAIVTPPEQRIVIPAGFTLYEHQREAIAAWQSGHRWQIWKWHRAAGKGVGSLALMVVAAYAHPATYVHVSTSFRKARENQWDALSPLTGRPYLDAIPPGLIVDRNENDLCITMRSRDATKVSRLYWLSADDADRLRGLHPRGVILDEFSVMTTADAMHVVRPALAASRGWMVITSTPNGVTNHFCDVWKAAENDPAWWCSSKTIEETTDLEGARIIPLAHLEQERREGQSEQWLRQEYFVEFTSALTGAYFNDVLDRAEKEGRIGDYPHRAESPVLVSFDLGVRDLTVATYFQQIGQFIHVIDCDQFEGLALSEILSRVRAKPYNFDARGWFAPHDLGQRDFTAADTAGQAMTRADVAAGLGVNFRIVPRVASVQENIDATRQIFGRLRFDRRKCGRLLEALGAYMRQWDARAKVFAPKPTHTWASHYADSLACFARGYRERRSGPHTPLTLAPRRDPRDPPGANADSIDGDGGWSRYQTPAQRADPAKPPWF